MKKLLAAGMVVMMLLALVGAVSGTSAKDSSDTITICHNNTDVKNPYIIETPDKSGDVSGHDGHNGPVATSEIVAQSLKDAHQSWGDIIPPFTYYTCTDPGYKLNGTVCTKNNQPDEPATVGNYPGKNWTTDGQAIYNNGCDYVTTTPTATPGITVTPTATPSATPTDTPTPTPGNSGCTSNCGGSDNNNNNNNNNSNNNSSNNSSQPTQAVLGASTMASTGTFDTTLMNLMFGSGLMTFGAGLFSLKRGKRA